MYTAIKRRGIILCGGAACTSQISIAVFIEYGNGSYDTYNNFSNAASVHGDGDIWHLGGGILGRMDFMNNAYAEGSFRMGGVKNKYSNADLVGAGGTIAQYKSSSVYSGLHLGTGYILNVNEKGSFDFYGKYFWSRQGGDSLTLSTGDPVDFKAANSHRVRLGGRYSHNFDTAISFYGGAAFEYEFDGKAKATTNGFDIDAPSLKGSTGIGELGLIFTPSTSLPMFIDLGVQGYVGQRRGVTGSLQIKFEF